MLSVSHEVATTIGGGTLHVWRISDLVYRPTSDVVAELKHHEEYILRGKKPSRHSEKVQRSYGPRTAKAPAPEGAKPKAPPKTPAEADTHMIPPPVVDDVA